MCQNNIYRDRIEQIRQLMHQFNVDALIVPSADPHLSEYLPDYWQARAWLSGFTGSMGSLVVLRQSAYLWADSRYWVQAVMQLEGSGIELQKIQSGQPSWGQFLADILPSGACVAIDAAVLSLAEHDRLQAIFVPKGIDLRMDLDLVGQIWQDRPNMPKAAVYAHPKAFVDQTISQKLDKVRLAMAEKGVAYHLISSLDDVAWITNLRGADVDFNPVFLAHLLVGFQESILFVDQDKLNQQLVNELGQAGVVVLDYDKLPLKMAKLSGGILVDPNKVAMASLATLSDTAHLVMAPNPSTLLKAIKSQAEIQNIRQAMRQDGAALCEFFAKLEDELIAKSSVSELDIDTWLTDARSRQPHYVSASFDTIAGFGANGAIVHYRATDEHHSQIVGDGLLLIDSGAQYYNGTTDITRMVGIGHVSDAQKRDVTHVLKAHIALAMAHFPENLPAGQLDVLARNQLWQQGLDYGHGTGHGVGYFLNVHEGPQSISPASLGPERAMKKGMLTSNEPGVYREGKWGVRLENCVLAVPAHQGEFGNFLKFETLTLCPFDTRLLLPELLNDTEKTWLNDYHQKVKEGLIGLVVGRARQWLLERTQPI